MPCIEKLIENYSDVLPERECNHSGSPIPSYLRGTMLRNGPGIFSHGDTKYNHWFDGDAFVQRYAFREGKMFYSARAIETDTHLLNRKANRIVVGSFGTKAFPDPCKNIFQRFFSYFQPETECDNALVAFTELGDTVYALTEIPQMVPISPDTLDVGPSIYGHKHLYSVHTTTAHCHSDEEGNVYNIGSRYGKNTEYIIVKMTPKKEQPVKGSLPFVPSMVAKVNAHSDGPAYFHSFGMSHNFFILLESPLRMNVMNLALRRYLSSSHNEAMSWRDSIKNTNVIVVDRSTGKKHRVKVTCAAFFSFHHANAFEKDDCVVVDYVRYRKVSDLNHLLIKNIKKADFFDEKREDYVPYPARMVVPLSIPTTAKAGDNLLEGKGWAGECKAILKTDGAIHVHDQQLGQHTIEFPRYNYRLNTKEYRYIYGTSILCRKEDRVGIVKIDCETKQTIVWRVEHSDQLAGEPILVNDPQGRDEDDGVLIVPVMTAREGESPFVVILSSRDLSEVARFTIPVDRIPFGFHGHFTTKHGNVQKKNLTHKIVVN